MNKHITVLKEEVIQNFNLHSGGNYFDLTLGGGGHTKHILKHSRNIKLFCLDTDKKAIESFRGELLKNNFSTTQGDIFENSDLNYVKLILGNFRNIEKIILDQSITKIDGAVADLGWSSNQLSYVSGLSFENLDENLDMRLDSDLEVKASDFLNFSDPKKLEEIFVNYADMNRDYKKLKTLLKIILKTRKTNAILNVGQMVEIVGEIGFKTKQENLNFLSRVFQSLRIAVNSEYENLSMMIKGIAKYLNRNGVLQIITFHSGEQNIVEKNFKELVQFGFEYESVVRPSLEELKVNINSRSAKLNILKKI